MATKKKKKLLIIDGHALIHRSFHALPTSMTTSKGEIVNAVYGFTSFLLKAIKELKPDMVALTMDKKGPTFRHESYKEYKATRVKAADELYEQIPRVKELATILAIPIFEVAGFEADDLIGTLSKRIKDAEKMIVTGDLDTLQLINKDTRIYTMSHGLTDSFIYDDKAVEERFGLGVDQMIDYKALRGDPSDNIPGVRGIGEKTAVELLQKFKTVTNLYKNINDPWIRPRIKELLVEHKKDALMSYDLATIKQDVPLEFDEADLNFGNFDLEKAVNFFREMEFKSLIPRLLQLKTTNSSKEQNVTRSEDKFDRDTKIFNYEIIDDEKKFKAFLKKLKLQKKFAFDIETSGLDSTNDRLVGLSFAWTAGEAYFVVVNQEPLNGKVTKDLFSWNKQTKTTAHPWLTLLKPILEDETIKKIGHNAKFDIEFLYHFGIRPAGLYFDTMIAAYVLNPGNRQYSLDAVSLEKLEFEKISKDDLLGSGKTKQTYGTVDIKRLGIYACEDADCTNRLAKILEPELKQEKLDKIFSKIEMPLVACLIDMELNGIELDITYLKNLETKVDAEIETLEKKIYQLAGMTFNIASPKQMQEVLFTKLKLSTFGIGKTKTGISTGVDELMKLKKQHPIIEQIMEYRELAKLSSTYIKNLPLLVNPLTKRLHTTFNQTIAATGRLSSTEPNLQNIPVKTELGRLIRHAFVAPKGWELISFDYSQIELRLAAHLSKDPGLVKAFKANQDIHTATAAAINQVDVSKVTKDMRRAAKAVNFGILYGQGPHGLSQTAEIPYEEAKDFIDRYFATYVGIKKYIDHTIVQAQKTGYVETLFGRKRFLPDINAKAVMVRRSAERMAINTPIQGTAADMIKLAMIEVYKFLKTKYQDKIKLLLQVHDELLFEIDPSIIKSAASEIKTIMENVLALDVPVLVDIKHGKNWQNMEEIVLR
ncbi:MAG: DNA polymerase I [Candidatus Falkowbacteria bacterium]|nr:DNA polymerase I [Candidatus Falkowbacteria bacterium]